MRSRASATVGRSSSDADRSRVTDGLATLIDRSGAAPVDEDEERRLAGTSSVRDRDWSWSAQLLEQDARPVAYVGTRIAADGAMRIDVTVAREGAEDTAAAIVAEVLDGLGSDAATVPVELWLRGATARDLEVTSSHGFAAARRLHVLGVRGEQLPPREVAPDSFSIESSTSADDAAVAALLSDAYPHADGGWDAEALRIRRASSWFRYDDVLLARPRATDGPSPDRPLLGVHWMKRRSATVGEVHNLAVHPEHQGRGIGPALLDAGLAQLVATGCAEVLLWVDADNASAIELYRSRGFTPRWDDVALRREAR
jgi:mycothiol synthase